MKLIIRPIVKLEKYLVMVKKAAISSVTNTIIKLHIQSDLNLIYKQNFYNDKQKGIYEIFDK